MAIRSARPNAHSGADGQPDEVDNDDSGYGSLALRRVVRSARLRSDAASLLRMPAEAGTIGRVFTAPSGQQYRPSMFVTLTLPSWTGPGR